MKFTPLQSFAVSSEDSLRLLTINASAGSESVALGGPAIHIGTGASDVSFDANRLSLQSHDIRMDLTSNGVTAPTFRIGRGVRDFLVIDGLSGSESLVLQAPVTRIGHSGGDVCIDSNTLSLQHHGVDVFAIDSEGTATFVIEELRYKPSSHFMVENRDGSNIVFDVDTTLVGNEIVTVAAPGAFIIDANSSKDTIMILRNTFGGANRTELRFDSSSNQSSPSNYFAAVTHKAGQMSFDSMYEESLPSARLSMDSTLAGPNSGNIQLSPVSGQLDLKGQRLHAITEHELTMSSGSCCQGITIEPPNGMLSTTAHELRSTNAMAFAISNAAGDIVLTPASGVVRVNGEIRTSGDTAQYSTPVGDVTTAGSILRGLASGGLAIENTANDIVVRPASGRVDFDGSVIRATDCVGLSFESSCGPMEFRPTPESEGWKSRIVNMHGNLILHDSYEIHVGSKLRVTGQGIESLDATGAGEDTVLIGQAALAGSYTALKGGDIVVRTGTGSGGGEDGEFYLHGHSALFLLDSAEVISMTSDMITVSAPLAIKTHAIDMSSQNTSLVLAQSTQALAIEDRSSKIYISIDTVGDKVLLGQNIDFLGSSFDCSAQQTSLAVKSQDSKALTLESEEISFIILNSEANIIHFGTDVAMHSSTLDLSSQPINVQIADNSLKAFTIKHGDATSLSIDTRSGQDEMLSLVSVVIQPTLTTLDTSRTYPFVSSLQISPPDITLAPSDTIMATATLYIKGVPSHGSISNYALYVAGSGESRFDGDVRVHGDLIQEGGGAITGDLTVGADAPFELTRPEHSTGDGTHFMIRGQDGAPGDFGGDLILQAGASGGNILLQNSAGEVGLSFGDQTCAGGDAPASTTRAACEGAGTCTASADGALTVGLASECTGVGTWVAGAGVFTELTLTRFTTPVEVSGKVLSVSEGKLEVSSSPGGTALHVSTGNTLLEGDLQVSHGR
jgi:hypothetical protein